MIIWEMSKDNQDVIKILTMILNICHSHDEMNQGTMAYVESDITLYTTFQKPTKYMEDFI